MNLNQVTRIVKLLAIIGLALLIFSSTAHSKVYEKEIDKYCKYYKYDDCMLVKSIIWHETNFKEKAYNPELSGSYGLMQVQCDTAKMMGLKYG